MAGPELAKRDRAPSLWAESRQNERGSSSDPKVRSGRYLRRNPRLVGAGIHWYQKGMNSNAKSSITLPREELRLVQKLKGRLRAKTNVEVVRRGLKLLDETTEREALREAYRQASLATRGALRQELDELDHLAAEGLK